MRLPEDLDVLVDRITAVDPASGETARARFASLATPPGALGDIQELGIRLTRIAGVCPPPRIGDVRALIAVADHGVHAQGVSPWPQEVTASMVRTFLAGTATANVFAQTVGATVRVLDVGVATDLEDHPALLRAHVRPGTRDLSREPAMTPDECVAAIRAGADATHAMIDGGIGLLVTGDMGIANTTAAAALIAGFTGQTAGSVTGRGTGVDDDALRRKVAAVSAAVTRHRDDDPLAVLAGVGGLEHAALVGAMLAAASRRLPILLDGVNTCAAALAAAALVPEVQGYLIAGHRSAEPGASVALEHLDLEPLLDLRLRLGEATGALLAVPVVRAAAAALRDIATLDDVLATDPPTGGSSEAGLSPAPTSAGGRRRDRALRGVQRPPG